MRAVTRMLAVFKEYVCLKMV